MLMWARVPFADDLRVNSHPEKLSSMRVSDVMECAGQFEAQPQGPEVIQHL